MITLDKIIIDDEFRDLLPRLADEQFAGLAESIRTRGWTDEPIVVWLNHGVLVDGHHRYEIWKAEGGEGPQVLERPFSDRDAVKAEIYRHQLDRRNLNSEQASYARGELYRLAKKPAGAPSTNKNATKNNVAKVATLNPAAEVVAKAHGVSARTVRNDAKFSEAVDKLDAQGVLPKAAALGGRAKSGVTRTTVIEAAKQETPEAAKAVLATPTTRDLAKAVSAGRKERKEASAVVANRHPIDKAIHKSMGELVRSFADRNKKFPSESYTDIGDLMDRVIALWKIWKGEAA